MAGIVRQIEKPSKVYESMPLWMQLVCNNFQAYASFWQDLTEAIVSCESEVVRLFTKGEDRKAAVMTGKAEALREQRHILEAYKKEEDENARTSD